jgi:hypothetical protein
MTKVRRKVGPTDQRRKRMIYSSYYFVEQYAKEIQTRRLTEAATYNNWSRVRKALRNLDVSRNAR